MEALKAAEDFNAVFQAFVVLLPGFVTSGIIRSLFVGEKQSDLEMIVGSVVWTFVDYVFYSMAWAVAVSLTFIPASDTAGPTDIFRQLPHQPFQLVCLFAVAVFVGLFVSFYKTNDGHKWLLRPVKITHRSTRVNVWSDVFVEVEGYATVNLADGRRVSGWPHRYSDDVGEPVLYLTNAEWLSTDDSGQQKSIKAGDLGLLILPAMGIQSIEFQSPIEPAALTIEVK